MQYSYELRDRAIHSQTPVLVEMARALDNHVFLDKGNGPIETGYIINYYLPQILLDELSQLDSGHIAQFRRLIFARKYIPSTVNILVFHRDNRTVPVFILAGSERKSISVGAKCC